MNKMEGEQQRTNYMYFSHHSIIFTLGDDEVNTQGLMNDARLAPKQSNVLKYAELFCLHFRKTQEMTPSR